MDNDQRIVNIVRLGEHAVEAKEFFDTWLNKKLQQETNQLLGCEQPEEFFAAKQRIGLLKEFQRYIDLTIQSGELAMDEYNQLLK